MNENYQSNGVMRESSAREDHNVHSGRRFLGFSLGAILPALGASLSWFCCLPIVAGVFGAGLAAAGSKLAPLRPYFTGLALVFLGIAFYKTYRPGQAACASNQSCAVQKNGVRHRILLWLIAGLTLALLTISKWSSWIIYWTL